MRMRFHINTKIRLLRILVLIVVVVMGYFGYLSVTGLRNLSDNLVETSFPLHDKLIELNESASKIMISQKTLLIPGLDKVNKVPDEIKALNDEIKLSDSIILEIDSMVEGVRGISYEQRQNWTEFKKSWSKAEANIEQYINRVTSYHNTGNTELYKSAYDMSENNLDTNMSDANELLLNQITLCKNKILADKTRIGDTSYNVYILLIAIILLSLIIILLSSLYSVRRISKPVADAVGSLTRLSQRLADAAGQVNSYGGQLSSAGSELSPAIEDAATAIDEFASAMTGRQELMQDVTSLSEETRALMADGINDMNNLKDSVSEIAESRDRISRLIALIEESAFQINILAINASVESTRAGDLGQSFAVFADEIRKTAQRSVQAAQEITAGIRNNNDFSKTCANQAEKCIQTLEQISIKTAFLLEQITEITAKANTQTDEVGRLTAAAQCLRGLAGMNSANLELSSTAVKDLNKHVAHINQVSEELYTLVYGAKPEPEKAEAEMPGIKPEKERVRL